MTTFTDMVYTMGGVPVLPGAVTTGNVFFVGNAITGAADTESYGRSPKIPFATWDYAINAATASNGDIIYLMPGHVETIVNATTIVPDKAGIQTIGLGRGMNRPIINFNHANAKIIFSGANQRVSNIVCRATITAVVLGVAVTADDVEIDNCFFTWETTGDEFLSTIDVSLFDRFNIHDCVFDSETGGGAASAISLNDTNDGIIKSNVFRGKFSASAILGHTVLSARLLILDNVIYNSATTTYGALDLGVLAATGIVKGNAFTSLYATVVAKSVRNAATVAMTWHNNTIANAVSERAVLTIPATSSA